MPDKRLPNLVRAFSGKRILVLGDLMLDQFIRGRVRRISPEAPVPVVDVAAESQMPGGAGNVCNNLASLGAAVYPVGIVGEDAAGAELRRRLEAGGMEMGAVLSDPERHTTQKCRVIADHQQVVRYDRETALPLSRRLQQRLAAVVQEQARRCHGFVLSDYGKGVLTPYVLKRAIVAARQCGIPVAVDPKVEHFRRYRRVTCITPNLAEAWGGLGLLAKDDEDSIRALGARILKTLQPDSVLITRGEKGMTLFENGAKPSVTHIPAQAREVYDVTGAGDTVISVLTLALAAGARLKEAAILANLAAGIVVGKLGTATVTASELLEAMP